MQSSDVIVACVAENRPNWYRMVENLAISTRNFGGRLASARIMAYFVEALDESAATILRELGVELKVVPRYDPAHPPTNKLRMFQDFAAHPDAAYLVALDCDTVVAGDFTDELLPGVVRAMPPGRSPLTPEQWQTLLSSLDLEPTDAPITTLISKEQMLAPYLNSGVVIVPAEHAVGLANAWTKYVDEFAAQTAAGVDAPWTGYFTDQVSLACALLDQHIPVTTLGPHVNLPTAIKLKDRVPAHGDLNIGLMHYHKHISDTGLLLETDSPRINEIIARVNAVLAARASRSGPSRDLRKDAVSLMRKIGSAVRS